MNELILLCAGAAADVDPDARGGMAPPRSVRLDRLLARGAVVRDDSLGGNPLAELPEDAWLRTRFGVPAGSAVEVLAGTALGVPLPCWQLTPCHLHLGMDHAMLIDPPQLQLSDAEADALLASVAPSFGDLGLRLLAPRPDTWYVHGEPWDLTAHAWRQASGRNIAAYQPHGPRARDWRRLLTEVQMLWHEHPVNRARAARGERAVNALWLDGFAAALPEQGAGQVFTDSPLLTGLAAAAGWSTQALSELADPAFAATPPATETPILIDLPWWRAPRRLGDLAAWQAAWTELDDWLARQAGLLSRLAASHSLRVVMTGERRVLELRADGSAAWQFWRRFDAHAVITAKPARPESAR